MQKTPLKATRGQTEPSPIGKQPSPGPSWGERVAPRGGSSVGSLRGLTAATAPCRSQHLPLPQHTPPRSALLSAGPLRGPRDLSAIPGALIPAQRRETPGSGAGAEPAVGAWPPARGRGSPSPGSAARGPVRQPGPAAASRFPYIRGCPGPVAGKRAERGILLPGFLLRAGCFALLKVPGLGKCFPFHSWTERLEPRR